MARNGNSRAANQSDRFHKRTKLVGTHPGNAYIDNMTWEEMDTPFFAITLDKDVNPATAVTIPRGDTGGAYQVAYSRFGGRPQADVTRGRAAVGQQPR
jgi:hypothetical protein